MVDLKEIRRELKEAFQNRGYRVVGASESGADYLIYLKVPKKKWESKK